MAFKGETWNESETYRDAWTLRQVRRITTSGLYNETPTYHTNICFTQDGEFLIFGSAREGKCSGSTTTRKSRASKSSLVMAPIGARCPANILTRTPTPIPNHLIP